MKDVLWGQRWRYRDFFCFRAGRIVVVFPNGNCMDFRQNGGINWFLCCDVQGEKNFDSFGNENFMNCGRSGGRNKFLYCDF